MTNHSHEGPSGSPPAASGAVLPPERPDGSYVKLTRAGRDGRPVVSILVREDNPGNPDEPHRWRAAEANSRWFTWQDLHAAGRIEPLFSHSELRTAVARAAHTPAPAPQAVAPVRAQVRPRGHRAAPASRPGPKAHP